MIFDLDIIKKHYASLDEKVNKARKLLHRPLTLTEKILYSHASEINMYSRGEDYVDFHPDRVAMQDATAQMALLQFMMAKKDRVAVPSVLLVICVVNTVVSELSLL